MSGGIAIIISARIVVIALLLLEDASLRGARGQNARVRTDTSVGIRTSSSCRVASIVGARVLIIANDGSGYASGCGGCGARIAGVLDARVVRQFAVDGRLSASEWLSFHASVDSKTRVLRYARNSLSVANRLSSHNGARNGGTSRAGAKGRSYAGSIDTFNREARIGIHALGSLSTASDLLGILDVHHARIGRSRAVRWGNNLQSLTTTKDRITSGVGTIIQKAIQRGFYLTYPRNEVTLFGHARILRAAISVTT